MSKHIATWNPARGVWETTRTNMLCGHSEPYLETWPRSGSMRNGQAFEHPISVLPTVGSESSSSHGREISLFPTLRASDGEKGGPNQRDSRGGLTMSSAVQRLI